MNLPNKLTIIRIILTPVFLFLFTCDFVPHHGIFALIVFVTAVATDFADGKIARSQGIVTNFGKIADPIADKILTTAALLGFMKLNLCNIWVILVVLAREFTVSAIRIVAASQGEVVPANIFGKIKTASQMIFSTILLVLIAVCYEFGTDVSALSTLSNTLMWIIAALTAASGAVYINDSRKVIDFTK